MGERLGHGHQLGIAAVGVAAGRPELLAEVLLAPAAEGAVPARGEDPGDADPIAEPEGARPRAQRRDPPDDLMAQDDRQARRGHPALDLVQLGMADAAGLHVDQHLAAGRGRIVELHHRERRGVVEQRSEGVQGHGTHGCRSSLVAIKHRHLPNLTIGATRASAGIPETGTTRKTGRRTTSRRRRGTAEPEGLERPAAITLPAARSLSV